MNTFKKLSAVLLAVVLLLAVTTTAFAEETVNNETTTHTYDVYQIFVGTQSATDTTGKLAVTGWGSGIKAADFLAALKASDIFKKDGTNIFADIAYVTENTGESAKKVAEALCKATTDQARAFGDLASLMEKEGDIYKYKYLTTTKAAEGVTNGTVTLDPGYYLVVDVTEAATVANNDAKNTSLLQVTQKGDFKIEKKYTVPTATKKVKDINDTTGETTDWQDSADYDIGDSISFQLKGTLPSNYNDYETYFYQFNDTLSAGLTYNGDAKVYVVNGTARTEVTAQFDVTGAIATIKCENLKAITGATINENSEIVVEYTARLNENAVAGKAGNENKVTVTYSNNPNTGGAGDTGTTPEDKVVVFTYKVIVNKTDGTNPLKGAEFTLSKKMSDGTKKTIAVIDGTNNGAVNTDTTSFAFVGLDDGIYILEETTVPAGYNGIESIEFTITSAHDADSAAPTLTSLDTNNITSTPDLNAGTLTTTVVNNSGYVLPETGGLGTTLFYVFGAILVIGAGVLLVAKKRMSVSDN